MVAAGYCKNTTTDCVLNKLLMIFNRIKKETLHTVSTLPSIECVPKQIKLSVCDRNSSEKSNVSNVFTVQ